MIKEFRFIYFFVLLFFMVGAASGNAEEKLEQYLKIELKRLGETYRLLDRFAEEIWPTWDSYEKVEYRVRFPNHVHLLYNPRKDVPQGYEPLPGIKLRGKPVYINRKKELPITIVPPLCGGGGGGLTVRIRLRQVKVSPEKLEEMKKEISQGGNEKEPGYQPYANSESQILLNVHEYFHGYQESVGAMEGYASTIGDFKVSAEFAAYSNIEGLSLMRAYQEKDKSKALEYLQDFVVAREIKQKSMPPEVVAAERSTSLLEGTASYVSIKMAMLIREKKYKAGMSRQDDPFFFDFKFMKGYIENHTTLGLSYIKGHTFHTIAKCYDYGTFQCLLLDRFVPGWKKDFFRGKKNLDEVISQFLKLHPEEKKVIARRINTRYSYDKLYAKHDAVIKERDKSIELVKNRKGKKYILDSKKTGEFFHIMAPPGKMYFIGIERLYPHGIRKYVSGQIEITSNDTPLYSPTLHILEWVDTETQKGERGYEISFANRVKDTYKNVVFKTKGFTLKAPEVKIIEDKEKNEVRITILTKAARKNQ